MDGLENFVVELQELRKRDPEGATRPPRDERCPLCKVGRDPWEHRARAYQSVGLYLQRVPTDITERTSLEWKALP
jgi:hypothetical protein